MYYIQIAFLAQASARGRRLLPGPAHWPALRGALEGGRLQKCGGLFEQLLGTDPFGVPAGTARGMGLCQVPQHRRPAGCARHGRVSF